MEYEGLCGNLLTSSLKTCSTNLKLKSKGKEDNEVSS